MSQPVDEISAMDTVLSARDPQPAPPAPPVPEITVLSAVRPGAAPAPAAEAPPEAPCPRCGARLIDPGNLGWCPRCGYCRSLAEDAAKAPPPQQAAAPTARRPSFLGAVEFWELLMKTPVWARILALGVVIVVGVSIAADLLLPDDSLARALWSSLQLTAAFILLFLAQLWVMFLVVAGDDKLGPKDLFLSFRLWAVAVKRLPETRKPVWLGTWCLTAGLCAVLVIGGLGYWGRYYHPKRVATRGIRHAVAVQEAGGTDSLEESVRDAAAQAVKDEKKKDKDQAKEDKPRPDPRPAAECVIIGYTLSADGKLNGLVLATTKEEKLAFAGVVRRGLTPEVQQELLPRLEKLKRDEPLIRGLRLEAFWVKPRVFCEVHQSGQDKDGRLTDPNFKGILE